jgi:hypothetical protein
MSRLLALLCLLVLLPLPSAASAEGRPTRATLQKVMELHERSVVRVRGPRRTGPGVIVGSGGQVLTSVEHVSLEAAQVDYAGRTLPATVVLANAALKFALVAPPRGTYPAVPVRVGTEGTAGQWLIGVVRGGKRQPSQPKVGRARAAPAPFFDVDLALAPGSPLFDASGRLVAVAVQRRGRGCRALPLSAVKVHLAAADTP